MTTCAAFNSFLYDHWDELQLHSCFLPSGPHMHDSFARRCYPLW